MENADAFDLLHRLDALAHDAFDAFEQPATEQRSAGCVGKDVLGFVEEFLRFGFDGGTHLLRSRCDPYFFGLLFRDEHFDRTPAARHFAFTYSLYPFLCFDGLGASRFGLGLRGGLFERFPLDLDIAFHAGGFYRRLTANFELTQFALADDTGLVEASLRSDTCAFDLFAGRDLGLLQRLHARDLELLHGSPALETGKLDGLFAHDVGALDVLCCDDIGFLHPTIGFRALGELGRDFDRTVLIGDLNDLAPLGVEDLARLR